MRVMATAKGNWMRAQLRERKVRGGVRGRVEGRSEEEGRREEGGVKGEGEGKQ